jgi:hypothetical protein
MAHRLYFIILLTFQKESKSMNRFKNYKTVLVVIAALLLFAGWCGVTGCGGGGGSSSGSAVATNTNVPTPDNLNLPPDPGEAGKATLEGIDSDGDGVRDDIQRYIALTYPKSEKARAALTQEAKVMQAALVDANDKEKSVQHGRESGRSSECLLYVFGTVDAKRETRFKMEEIIFNTDERNRAYFTYNDQLGNEVFSSIPYDERASACDFDVDALQN